MKKAIYILITLIFPFVGMAAAEYSPLDERIYKITYQQCSQGVISMEHAMHMVGSMHESRGVFEKAAFEFNLNPTIKLFRDRGLTALMAATLNSVGFYDALNKCFPASDLNSSFDKRHLFVATLITADVVGRGVGSVQGYLELHYIAKIFMKILDVVPKLTYFVISRVPYLKTGIHKFAQETVVATIRKGMYSVLFALPFYDVYQARENSRLKQLEAVQNDADILRQAWKSIIQLEMMRRSSKNDLDRCRINNEQFKFAEIANDVFKNIDENQHSAMLSKYKDLKEFISNSKYCELNP